MSTETELWDYFLDEIGNEYGVAGLLGNIYAESALKSNNLQGSYEKKLGMSDDEYTAAVDDGTYTAFSSDRAGYGLCQWTYPTRKAALKAYHDSKKKSIADQDTQCAYIFVEMKKSYSSVLKTLKSATSVREASDAVMLKYLKPANQTESNQEKRASYGEEYYKKYAKAAQTESAETATKTVKASRGAASKDTSLKGTYKTTTALNIRDGASTSYKILTTIPKGTEVKNYGYYTKSGSNIWLYVQFTYKKVTYIGFAHNKYLVKE